MKSTFPGGRKSRQTIGYIRVSSAEQSESGVSLSAQEERIRSYVRAMGQQLDLLITDAGESAKNLKRPGMKRLLELIARRQVKTVIILKLDRITRSIRDLVDLIDLFEKHNSALISVSETIDTQTAAGRMLINLLGVLSQWEREIIGERTAFALAHKRKRREVYGPTPFGWSRVADKLVTNCSEQRALRLAQRMRTKGASLREIADTLSIRGVRPRRSAKWYPQTVKDILSSLMTTGR